jgi:PST family polysaccharide transporter
MKSLASMADVTETGTMPPAGTAAHPGVHRSPRSAALGGKALEIGTQVLLITFLPRLLGPAEFGRLTVALAVVTVAAVAISLGAPGSFARFVPTESAHRRSGLAWSMTRRLVPLRAVQLLIAALIGVALVYSLPGRVAAEDVTLVLVALAAEVAAILAAQMALGLGATWIWSFRIAARNAALLVSVPVLLLAFESLDLVWTVALGSFAGLLFAASRVAPLVRSAERGVPVPEGAMRFGRVSGTALLVGQLTYRGPVFAASAGGLAPEAVGFAGLAASIAMAVIYAVRELFTVSIPELVECWERAPDEADRRLRRLGQHTQWILIGAAGVGVVVLARLLPMVVGTAFLPATGPLALVLATLPLVPLAAIAAPASSLRLRPGLPLVIDGVALLVFIAAVTLLMPRWGATGTLAALLAAVATSAILAARAVPGVVTLRLLATGLLGSSMVLALGALAGSIR